jgi:DNA topoisomerase-1
MAKNLLIVESPGKILKIQGFLGKDYKVVASIGHIRELDKGAKGVDKKNNYTPSYIISEGKKDVCSSLKKLAKESDTVYLASDADREGESIAWHVKEVINVPDKKIKRITFTEITKKAIEDAIKNPRQIDMDLFHAQEARRVLDRLVGFDLSPLLWSKVKMGLSGGRVQSPATRLIVEREKEIQSFEAKADFKTTAVFETDKKITFKALLNKKFEDSKSAKKFLEQCIGKQFTIKDLEVKPGKKTPSAPFVTSSLQQTAGTQLGFGVDRTMRAAQKLYEAGEISYHRTDSVVLSEEAIKSISSEIKSRFGEKYLCNRVFKSKSASAQEAHEPCRPTHFEKTTAGSDSDEQRLYELIWKRTMASQMSDAITERTVVYVNTDGVKEEFIARGEIIKFDGFLKVYTEVKNEEDEEDETKLLPPLKKGEKVNAREINSFQSFTKPTARFNEPGLVKKMEEIGIGRPSTYASTISTIIKRGYVEKRDLEAKERKIESLTLADNKITESARTEKYGSEKGRLCPTDTGMIVVDYLMKNFSDDIMDYQFTANAEEKLDDIAEGKLDWVKMIDDFYKPFSVKIKGAAGTEGKAGVRELGNDPKTGKPIIARLGRFGPMVQLGESKAPEPKEKKGSIESKVRGKKDAKPATKVVDEDKPKFAKLRQGQSIETITIEEALKLLAWPRILGKHKGSDVIAAIGKFGPYVKVEDTYCSVKEPDDIETIGLERALELYVEKAQAKASMVIKEFKSKNIRVLNGKFGPYIKAGDKNCKIPAHYEAEKLTLEECEEIVKNTKPSKKWQKKKEK